MYTYIYIYIYHISIYDDMTYKSCQIHAYIVLRSIHRNMCIHKYTSLICESSLTLNSRYHMAPEECVPSHSLSLPVMSRRRS